MKLALKSTSSAVGSHRLLLVLACLSPLLALAAPPGWWSDRQVLDSNATKNDYGPANHGQLKNIATKAYAELQAKLPASAWNSPNGQALAALVASWNPAQGDNYAPVNQGQLKAVAKTFYDVLIQEGYATGYPWTATNSDDANYTPANIGQVKNVFAFDLGSSVIDSDGNGLSDSWEIDYFGHIGTDSSADPDGDGLTNLQEYQNGTNPLDYFNGGSPTLTKISGDNQQGPPSSFLPLPLTVKISDSTGQPLNNAPVTFAVVEGGGLLAASANGATATFMETRTDSAGMAAALYLQGPTAGVTSHIAAIAADKQATFSVTADNGELQPLAVAPPEINATVNAGTNSLIPITLTNNTPDAISYTVGLDGDSVENPSYADSDQLGGPAFVWNDISGAGVRLAEISNADDASEPVDLSFAFPYFGSSYSKLYVNSNGFVTLGEDGGDYTYYRLPDPNAPANEIAAFHTDLYLNENGGGSGDVYFRDFGDHAIIQFSHAARLAQDGLATFQIVLNADGTILFYYLDVSGTLDDCVVGLQNAAKDAGLTVAYQQHYLKNNLAVRLVDSSKWMTVTPTSGILASGENTTLDVVLDARAFTSGTFNGAIRIDDTSSHESSVTVPVTMKINAGPELTIISPREGWLFAEATEMTLEASALDQDGVSKVEFYDGSIKLGEATAAPYTFRWQNLPFGTHAITALALDNLGAVRRSSPVQMEVQADTDHDGIGDGWEMSYFGSLAEGANGDFDQDGLTNAEEWNLRVNPAVADSDGDGVSDGDEVHEYHTDPSQNDSDGDGLSDSWEINYGLDPLHDDSQVDSDGDGLTNAEELALATVPNNPDSDGDGVFDGVDGWPLHPQLAPTRVPAVKYAVIDLGEGFAAALNNHGDVVGTNGQSPAEAMLWKMGQSPVALGFLTNDTSAYRVSAASAINDDGTVVGRASYSWDAVVGTDYPNPPIYNQLLTRFDNSPEHNLWWDTHAFRWTNGVMSDLNDLSYAQHGDGTTPDISNKGTSAATSINQSGVVVGDSDSSVELNTGWYWEIVSEVQHAVRFDGVPVDLGLGPPPGEAGGSTAYAINDSGSIIGFQSGTGGDSGYFLAEGQMETLPFYPGGLNNLDQVVGSMSQSNRYLATMWVRQPLLPGVDRIVDLDAIARNAGFVGSSFASRISDRAEILGEATPPHAFQNAAAIWRNGQITALDDLLGDPTWAIATAAINSNGMIAATGFNNANPNGDRALLLLPVELMVDGNRDGEMSFADAIIHDRDQTTAERPYRFWLNDDDDTQIDPDSGEATEVERVPATFPDYLNNQIVSKRNLEDFARIWIYIGGLHEAINSGSIQIGIKWKTDISGNPAINIYPSADGEGSDNYVKDDNAADTQISGVFNDAVADKTNKQVIDTNGTFIFKSNYWTGLSSDNPKKCLLFEGASEGKGELEIVFFDSNGTQMGSGGSVWLDLKNIKKMYQRYDASEHNQWAPVSFEADPTETDETIVFVHGWNQSPDGSSSYAETVFKRLWHRGFKGRTAAVRWNTDWSSTFNNVPVIGQTLDAYLADYNDSEHKAWLAGNALKTFASSLPGRTKNFIAHSMGNVVVGSALRHGMAVNKYALLHAAVPASCYDTGSYLEQLQTAGAFGYIYWDTRTPDDDPGPLTSVLAYRGRLSNVQGDLINFFLPQDRATTYAWEFNNRAFKPTTRFFYDRNEVDGSRLWKNEGGIRRSLTDPEEAMPYADQSWSKVAGADGRTAGAITSPGVDLNALFGFADDHSAEFIRNIQQLQPFYVQLLESLDVSQNP